MFSFPSTLHDCVTCGVYTCSSCSHWCSTELMWIHWMTSVTLHYTSLVSLRNSTSSPSTSYRCEKGRPFRAGGDRLSRTKVPCTGKI